MTGIIGVELLEVEKVGGRESQGGGRKVLTGGRKVPTGGRRIQREAQQTLRRSVRLPRPNNFRQKTCWYVGMMSTVVENRHGAVSRAATYRCMYKCMMYVYVSQLINSLIN